MNEISLKWKIFIFLIGFSSILVMLLWLFQVVFLNNFYKTIKINEIKSSAKTISKNIDSDRLLSTIQDISIQNNVCVEVFFSNSGDVYSSDVLRECTIHKMSILDKINILNITEQNEGKYLEYFTNDSNQANIYNKKNQDFIIYSQIITNKNGDVALILLNSVVSPVNATVNTLRIQLYYITGFTIIFSIILAFIISRRVSHPIEMLNKSAKILAKGNYETKFYGSGYKEISELSDTLNYTAKELSKVESLRQELIANISHDLRTPLTLISGYAEVMRDLPSENNKENAQIIIDETRKLTTLVNDLLDISKFQSGVETLFMEEKNITNIIETTIDRMNKFLKKEKYQIDFSYKKEILVKIDETKLIQAFYNLLINAINYTGEDKKIFVKQEICDNKVKISVIDTGLGIEEDKLPYIWDRYYKVDKTHKRAVTGTGLGLSIVKSIIEMHQGEYGVYSTNSGSTFWFSLKYK